MVKGLYGLAAVLFAVCLGVLFYNAKAIFENSLPFAVAVTYVISPLTFLTYATVIFVLARILELLTDSHRPTRRDADDRQGGGRDWEDDEGYNDQRSPRIEDGRGRRRMG
jgi:urea transporter